MWILNSRLFDSNTDCEGGYHEKRLLHDLLDTYNVLERPVVNESDPLQLSFGLTLMQIIDVVRMPQLFGDQIGGYHCMCGCQLENIFHPNNPKELNGSLSPTPREKERGVGRKERCSFAFSASFVPVVIRIIIISFLTSLQLRVLSV